MADGRDEEDTQPLPAAIAVPFEFSAGTPLRMTFTDCSGKRWEATLGAIPMSVEDKGPEHRDPNHRFEVRWQWAMHIKAR